MERGRAAGERERTIRVVREVRGTVAAPPSKSVTQRALVASALADGRSVLANPLLADDPSRLIAALNAVGIAATVGGSAGEPSVAIDGRGGRIPAASANLVVGNAGTAMRFLTALLACGHGSYLIDGDARMRQRPIEELLAALRGLGARAEAVNGDGCPPVRVGGRGLPGGETRLPGTKSSQYLSALLLASPASERGVAIEVGGRLVSRPYVDLTLDVMRRFGVAVDAAPPGPAALRFAVAPGRRYTARAFTIEGDYSSASYFFAAAAVCGGRVQVTGLDPGSRQGDAGFLDLLRAMGCRVESSDRAITVEGDGSPRGLGEADLAAMPDLAPTLAVVALFASAPTRIAGVPHLRLKETDRIAALVAEIRRLGGDAEAREDGLVIRPRPLSGARIETYRDHRMAMAFAVAGLRVPGVVIADPGCVAKSFPGFWERFDRLAPGGA